METITQSLAEKSENKKIEATGDHGRQISNSFLIASGQCDEIAWRLIRRSIWFRLRYNDFSKGLLQRSFLLRSYN